MHVFVFRTTSFFSPTSVECLALPAFLSLIERGTFPLLVVFHGCLITSACSPRPCQHILLFTSTLHRPLLFSIPILSLSLALSLSLSLYLDLYLSFALSLLQLTFPISFPPFSGHSNKSRLYNLSSSHPTASLPLLPSPSLSLPSLIPQSKNGAVFETAACHTGFSPTFPNIAVVDANQDPYSESCSSTEYAVELLPSPSNPTAADCAALTETDCCMNR